MKEKTKLTICFTLLVIMFLMQNIVCNSQNSNPNFTGKLTGPLQEADLIIDLSQGITLGDEFTNSLKESFGKPLKVNVWSDDEGPHKSYVYHRYEIFIDTGMDKKEYISVFTITGKGIQTNRGLMIGDDINKVEEKYGLCESIEKYKNEIIYKYFLRRNQKTKHFIEVFL